MKCALLLFAVCALVSVRALPVSSQEISPALKCGLCGLVANTVEGFVKENLTETAVMNFIEHGLCDKLKGVMQSACQAFESKVPQIVSAIEGHETVSKVCLDLKMCEKPREPRPETTDMRKYEINLDLPAEERWVKVMSEERFRNMYHTIRDILDHILPHGVSRIESIGETILSVFPQPYRDEIKGAAKGLDISPGLLAFGNLGYELSDLCTSIVAQAEDGSIYHARNLDFGIGMGFTDLLRSATLEIAFTKGGKTVYNGVSYAGFVGLLTGQKPQGYAVTVNTRFYPGPVWDMFSEVIEVLKFKGAAINGFMIRDVLDTVEDYPTALQQFQTRRLIADVYLTVSGTKAGEGCVISRNQTAAEDTMCLDAANGKWYVSETNYDNWKKAPWFDNRRFYVHKGMDEMGQKALTFQGLLNVLSTKPVLNLMTTYSILADNQNSTLVAYDRYCNDPCPE